VDKLVVHVPGSWRERSGWASKWSMGGVCLLVIFTVNSLLNLPSHQLLMDRLPGSAQLLIRYLRVPADALFQSLHAARIEADMQAKPVFIDDQPMGRARVGSSAFPVSCARRWQHDTD
jgi:hypothetical protein